MCAGVCLCAVDPNIHSLSRTSMTVPLEVRTHGSLLLLCSLTSSNLSREAIGQMTARVGRSCACDNMMRSRSKAIETANINHSLGTHFEPETPLTVRLSDSNSCGARARLLPPILTRPMMGLRDEFPCPFQSRSSRLIFSFLPCLYHHCCCRRRLFLLHMSSATLPMTVPCRHRPI